MALRDIHANYESPRDPRLGKSVGADPVQPGLIPDKSAMDSQIKLFTSLTVLSRVAAMADLEDDPEFNDAQRSLPRRILRQSPALVVRAAAALSTKTTIFAMTTI